MFSFGLNSNESCMVSGITAKSNGIFQREEVKGQKSQRIFLPTESFKNQKTYFNSDLGISCFQNQNQSTYQSSENLEHNFLNSSESELYSPAECQKQFILENPSDDQLENEEAEASFVQLKSDIFFSREGHCINYEERTYNNIFHQDNQGVGVIVGYVFLTAAAVLFISTIFSIFFASYLSSGTHSLFEFLRTDNYYCYLIPLSAPVVGLTIYFNWLCMKYFKHS